MNKTDYVHGEFVIATTEVDYDSYRSDYEDFCEGIGCEQSKERFQRWCEDEAMENWDQDMENIRGYKSYNVPVKINGRLGLWWGRPEIEEVDAESVWDAIRRCTTDCAEEVVVKFNDGRIEVEVEHHDGTNFFTITRADGKRFKYLYA